MRLLLSALSPASAASSSRSRRTTTARRFLLRLERSIVRPRLSSTGEAITVQPFHSVAPGAGPSSSSSSRQRSCLEVEVEVEVVEGEKKKLSSARYVTIVTVNSSVVNSISSSHHLVESTYRESSGVILSKNQLFSIL